MNQIENIDLSNVDIQKVLYIYIYKKIFYFRISVL